MVEISNGGSKIFYYRYMLRNEGFRFIKKAYGKSFYKKKVDNITEVEKYQKFCEDRKLHIHIIKEDYIRNTKYRSSFFEEYRPIFNKYYLCIYCGKILPKEKVTVDHIFAIDKVRKKKYQSRMIKMGIDNVNDFKNLGAACKSCNSKKGSKAGIWIVRGFLGKHRWLWYINWTFSIFCIVVIFYIFKNCMAQELNILYKIAR